MTQLSLIDWLQTKPNKQISFYAVEHIIELTDKLYRRRNVYKGKNKSTLHVLLRMRCKYLVTTYGLPTRGKK
jgi:lysyl-tRNA synthetase class I